MILVAEFVVISICLFSFLTGGFLNKFGWSRKFKNFRHQSLRMLCTWYHLSTQRQQDIWRYFLLMRSRLAPAPFSCCKLMCGDINCSCCKIFCFNIQQHCNTFSYSCSIISFLLRFSSFRWLLLLCYSCYWCDCYRHSSVEFGLLKQSVLPVSLVSSQFLICQGISG